MGFPDAVRDARRTLLGMHLDRLTGAMVTPELAWWWTDIAADHDVALINPVEHSVSDASVVVVVDQFRHNRASLLKQAHGLGPAGRIAFSEIAAFDGRRNAVAEFDVTSSLWAAGLTVIDVDRVPVSTPAGTWHLVGGIARVTPPMQ